MEQFLKRSNENSDESQNEAKRAKRENCPHLDRCYRRNPHHFKEFEHPHLEKFIELGDSYEIPNNLPQPKSLYLEQIEILKPILSQKKKVDSNSNISVSITGQEEVKNKPAAKKSPSKNSSSASTSSSSRASSKVKKEKSSCFIPNSSDIPFKAMSTGGKNMLQKLEDNAPYNLFFTTIPKSPETLQQPNAVTFTDLLCPSLGVLKNSLQINFMIDVSWLLEQYQARNLGMKPLTILYGYEFPKMEEFMNRFCPNVTYKFVKLKDPFGCHHSKIGIYAYEDNTIRVVVSTANLYYEDWNHYNQGLWVSPACPKLPDSSTKTDGESPTNFKKSLLHYLNDYNYTELKPWIEYVERADFSDIKVCLVTSIPGKHYPKSNGSHVHRVADLLSQHCKLPAKTSAASEGPLSWGVVAQSSSLGSMGKTASEWLRKILLRSLASHTQGPTPSNSQATLNLIYPSVDNVMTGYFGAESGGCLPYSKQTNEKQKWLQDYMHQWRADRLSRTRAMPHIKSYCRVSPCLSKLAYFLLTSANISKSAWGGVIQKDMGVYIRSYEVGVMFLPNFFDEEYLEIENTVNNKNKNLFPIMYDFPLVPYRVTDYPWCN